MKGRCPHCGHDVFYTPEPVHPSIQTQSTIMDNTFVTLSEHEGVTVSFWSCPNCGHTVVFSKINLGKDRPVKARTVWPFAANRHVPSSVPKHIMKDYVESAEVLPISEEASAALSRRCLQTVLKESGGAKKNDLSDQIDEVLPSLPTTLRESVDHIRVIGNFAAHSIKSKASGQIIEVQVGEAEWNLDVLDMLFDFYYVIPAKAKEKRDAANLKLKAAGKPPMK